MDQGPLHEARSFWAGDGKTQLRERTVQPKSAGYLAVTLNRLGHVHRIVRNLSITAEAVTTMYIANSSNRFHPYPRSGGQAELALVHGLACSPYLFFFRAVFL